MRRRGLHILGAPEFFGPFQPGSTEPGAFQSGGGQVAAGDSKAAEYAPYVNAAGQVISSIVNAARSSPEQERQFALAQQQMLLDAEKSKNTVWYVVGGAAVLAVVAALVLRR